MPFPDPHLNEEDANQGVPLVETVVEQAPPWLFSTAVHLVVMIVLAMSVSQTSPTLIREIILQPVDLATEPNDDEGEEKIVYNVRIGDPNLPVSPISGNDPYDGTEIPIWTEEDAPSDMEMTDLPRNVGPKTENPNALGFGTENPDRTPIYSMYEGRGENVRRTRMFNGGGNETTEMAVERALAWLARQQYPKGYWSLRRGPRNNSYETSGVDNWVAATGLALLAFQGHGETCDRGNYQKNVKEGWAWLLLQQDDAGCFYQPKTRTTEDHNHPLYTQGICTIAICELYAMTGDPVLKEQLRLPAQKAIDYCVNSQTSSGGWKYGANDYQSDLSVTGWIVMALHSGRIAGLDVPQETYDRVTSFLDDIGEAGSKYPYQKGMNVVRSMTAEGLFCRQILGWDRDDPRLLEGADWLLQSENLICFTGRDEMNRRNPRDVYYWYYATLMFHNHGGHPWKTWNETMMQRVCENQERKEGENKGSWNPILPTQDTYASEGRLYVTCLSTYILEVYYRHLPIYRPVR
ncbi:MAG: terpene cyclase/mutase family protein [Planctomycetaceae bacterium]|nr:terpene cyclase/mutase family protein [Planctomycetaceae bacterium]